MGVRLTAAGGPKRPVATRAGTEWEHRDRLRERVAAGGPDALARGDPGAPACVELPVANDRVTHGEALEVLGSFDPRSCRPPSRRPGEAHPPFDRRGSRSGGRATT